MLRDRVITLLRNTKLRRNGGYRDHPSLGLFEKWLQNLPDKVKYPTKIHFYSIPPLIWIRLGEDFHQRARILPAAATSISTPPNISIVCATAASTLVGSVTSNAIFSTCALGISSRIRASTTASSDSFRATSTTEAPVRAKARAAPSPIPRDAPVTITHLLWNVC